MLRRLITMLALLAALGPAACGSDEDEGDSRPPPAAEEEQTETEPSPSEQRRALMDTSTKPEIPRPSGSPPRKLAKDDIVRGRGQPAKPGDTVTVHYAGVTFSTGNEFDASWNSGQPYTFSLGAGDVIPGWDKGLVGMKEGGRRMLTIPPEMAYGAAGSPPVIGPNETLVFVVDLVSID